MAAAAGDGEGKVLILGAATAPGDSAGPFATAFTLGIGGEEQANRDGG